MSTAISPILYHPVVVVATRATFLTSWLFYNHAKLRLRNDIFPTQLKLAAILEFTFTRYFFNPENNFNGFQNLGKDTKFITPRQIPMELYWV